jgi:endonuclease-3
MIKKNSNKIITILRDLYGDVKPDLDFNNLYELTIAVVLSAQTTDKQVNGVTPQLFAKYPDFDSLSRASQKDVEKIIHSTGFYRNKAKNIIALGKEVVETFSGILPSTMEKLVTLPGVGRKSANVVISMGYNRPALAVDTHVARISKRLGYTTSENPMIIEKDLMAALPESQWIESHLLFIKHGRMLCIARKPKCEECPLKELCPFFLND